MRVLDQTIADFLSTLNLGLEWIGDAGKKLVAMMDTNPSAFDDILDTNPPEWITRDVLRTIEQIGRGKISPELLVLPLHVFNRLSSLPTLEQIKAMQNGVEVVSKRMSCARPGGFTREKKLACKLTVKEAKRAIGPRGIRSPAEQEAILKNGHSGAPKSRGWYRLEKVEDGQDPDEDFYMLVRLDGPPKSGETHRLLVKSMECSIEFLE